MDSHDLRLATVGSIGLAKGMYFFKDFINLMSLKSHFFFVCGVWGGGLMAFETFDKEKRGILET